MNNDLVHINTLPPFKRMCVTIGNLPTSFMESMTYYEALQWLYNYLDTTVIPAINLEGEAITELQTAFTTLKNYVDNYFDNLDVQEEINNKLDDMAESGQLTDIIAQYLGLAGVLAFNTVADMKNATNLVNGSTAKTLGYFNKNDLGGALYKIRTITNSDVIDETTIISLYDDTLIAELIFTEDLNSRQLGVYGDKTHDDTLKLQAALNLNKKITLIGEIKITDNIDIDVGLHKGINGISETKILADFTNGEYAIFNLSNSLYDNSGSGIYGTADRFCINNLYLSDITETNNTSTTHHGYGIQLGDGCCNLSINNCIFRNLIYGLYAPSTSSGVYSDKLNNCYFRNNDYGIYINTSSSNDSGENFRFINCNLSTSKLGNYINNDMYVNFIGCSLDYNLGNTLIIKDSAVVSLTNCHIEWYASTPLINIQYNASLSFNSCIFYRTNYDDGGNNTYFITALVGDSVPKIIFNSSSFTISRAYTNMCDTNPYIKFVNCSRGEYIPTAYFNPYFKISATEAINYVYPLNYDSGLTRNTTKIKVTCNTVKNGNAIILPFDYDNEDARIILKVKSSVAISSVIDIGNGLFLGEGLAYSSGVLSSTHSISANEETTITIYHKFRKGTETKPFIKIHLNELTQGSTFEVTEISYQLL